MNRFELTLDLDKRGGVAQWVTLRQGDHNGTELRATIYDHGVQAGGGYTCRVSIRLPGAGDEYYRETATYTNGVAVVTVDEEYAAAIVGVTEGYFELLQGDAVIASTESFGVRILRSAQDGAVPGDKYDSAIEDALAELDEATGRISQMVVDATEEYLEAHPELTTTVEDNSLTDAKLIQHGGILDRVARLWHRLDNLLTATPAEADALTVSDAAKTPLAGLALYGRSTQDGTPTPDAPVAIQSVQGNLLDISESTLTPRQTIDTTTGQPKPATAGDWLAPLVDVEAASVTFVVNDTGTYGGSFNMACYKASGEFISWMALGRVTTTKELPSGTGKVRVYGYYGSGYAYVLSVTAALYAGSQGALPYVPYHNVGLWAKRTSDATQQSVTPIPLQGHTLRSLPDGTRDEVTVDQYGHAVLTQRVGVLSILASDWGASSAGRYRHYVDAEDVGLGTGHYADMYCTAYQPTANTSSAAPANTIRFAADGLSLWLAAGSTLVDSELTYILAEPRTIDLGTVDPVALQGPDMTAQVVPTAPFALTYERDLNTTLARLEASIAELATN